MLSLLQRSILFLTVCLPIRIIFFRQALKYPDHKYTILLSYFYLLAGIGIIYLYMTNGRLQAFESGGKLWWNNLRPFFGLLWLGFFISILFKFNRYSYIFLFAEVLLGLTAFLVNMISILIAS